MTPRVASIIRNIEEERDNFVKRCNEAINQLLGPEIEAEDPLSQKQSGAPHRFNPTSNQTNTPQSNNSQESKSAAVPSPRRRGRPPKNLQTGSEKKSHTGQGPETEGKNFSVRDLVKEAIRSQTKPFTRDDIEIYIKARYPGIAPQISSKRYSNEMSYLRVTEKMISIISESEEGGPKVYNLIAA
ncbi:MAG: hypothetical protein H2172_00730 [Opitutus sp.]|nr:hypothetical protein [Opitutus sp.]MCS6246259.1 hypothetical protein [Opitutus sp.]MCS6273792.1 hypothetical protein [Opitutus sp.]MCS6277266.1 hypothetical protein [Opitutus sp.]MCS6300388.1 hypothetical protein [Opitutus sp.]